MVVLLLSVIAATLLYMAGLGWVVLAVVGIAAAVVIGWLLIRGVASALRYIDRGVERLEGLAHRIRTEFYVRSVTRFVEHDEKRDQGTNRPERD